MSILIGNKMRKWYASDDVSWHEHGDEWWQASAFGHQAFCSHQSHPTYLFLSRIRYFLWKKKLLSVWFRLLISCLCRFYLFFTRHCQLVRQPSRKPIFCSFLSLSLSLSLTVTWIEVVAENVIAELEFLVFLDVNLWQIKEKERERDANCVVLQMFKVLLDVLSSSLSNWPKKSIWKVRRSSLGSDWHFQDFSTVVFIFQEKVRSQINPPCCWPLSLSSSLCSCVSQWP